MEQPFKITPGLDGEDFIFFLKGPFSQWVKSPFTVNFINYCCCEQFMMAGKALFFDDVDTYYQIMDTKSPSKHQQLGRQVKDFDKDEWSLVARRIVYNGNYAKFTQNEHFKYLILSTGDATLVETNPRDSIWGIALAEGDPRALSRSTWLGTNWLGEVLTQVRNDIRRLSCL